tara:strand:- start:575 stop:1294 length:720 start_codon:yes stop_codon:yes gene_type:complete
MNVLPITREGGLLAKLRAMFGPEAQIQEGDVRVEKVLLANDVAERFNLNGDGQARRPLEVFIGLNDLVIPYALKIALNKVDTTLPGNNGNSQDITYPDLSVFNNPATATAVSESDALNAVYSGAMSIKANTIEILNTEQLRRFKIIPQTQGAATTLPETSEMMFVPIIQPAIFSGRDTNILEFTPAPGSDQQLIGGAAGTQNVLVFHYKVLVVRNGAQPATWTEVSDILEQYTQNRVIL